MNQKHINASGEEAYNAAQSVSGLSLWAHFGFFRLHLLLLHYTAQLVIKPCLFDVSTSWSIISVSVTYLLSYKNQWL